MLCIQVDIDTYITKIHSVIGTYSLRVNATIYVNTVSTCQLSILRKFHIRFPKTLQKDRL